MVTRFPRYLRRTVSELCPGVLKDAVFPGRQKSGRQRRDDMFPLLERPPSSHGIPRLPICGWLMVVVALVLYQDYYSTILPPLFCCAAAAPPTPTPTAVLVVVLVLYCHQHHPYVVQVPWGIPFRGGPVNKRHGNIYDMIWRYMKASWAHNYKWKETHYGIMRDPHKTNTYICLFACLGVTLFCWYVLAITVSWAQVGDDLRGEGPRGGCHDDPSWTSRTPPGTKWGCKRVAIGKLCW